MGNGYTLITCALCGTETMKLTGGVNRSRREGAPIYCSQKCSGIDRRIERTLAEKVEIKRLYDIEYRKREADMLKRKKREYFKQTYDPAKEAIKRKASMPRHVEYCRRPEYREKKAAYDQKHRACKVYGEFADVFLMLQEIETEVASRSSNYDIRQENGTNNKTKKRKRALNNGSIYSENE